MDISALYSFVLLLVLTGLVVGVGIVVLDKFMNTTGLSTTAVNAINKTILAIYDIPNSWLGLIVTIVVLVIVVVLVVKGFGGTTKTR